MEEEKIGKLLRGIRKKKQETRKKYAMSSGRKERIIAD